MNKIGIIICHNESKVCTSYSCFKAFNTREASFTKYDKASEIVCFVHCNGCSYNNLDEVMRRAGNMREKGVDTIHLSTCIKLYCPYYDEFFDSLSKDYSIIGYTH